MNTAKPKKAFALGGKTLRTVKSTRRSTKPRKGEFAEMGDRPVGRTRELAAALRNPRYFVPSPPPKPTSTRRKR